MWKKKIFYTHKQTHTVSFFKGGRKCRRVNGIGVKFLAQVTNVNSVREEGLQEERQRETARGSARQGLRGHARGVNRGTPDNPQFFKPLKS